MTEDTAKALLLASCTSRAYRSFPANNVDLAVGDAFPIGWNFLTGDREYASVTEELLQEAQCLSSTLESELTMLPGG